MSYNDLENYLRTQFQLNQDFRVSLTEQDAMVPWERDIYIALLEERARETESQEPQI